MPIVVGQRESYNMDKSINNVTHGERPRLTLTLTDNSDFPISLIVVFLDSTLEEAKWESRLRTTFLVSWLTQDNN